jgi:hypothetical protein
MIFEQVKSGVTVSAVVEKYHTAPNRSNKVRCPFHDDDTPSMSIKEPMWQCFGCGAAGDAIRFVARIKQVDDYQAATLIIQDFNLAIDIKASPQNKIRTYIKEAQSQVHKTDYFKRRGLTDETIKQFGLGYDECEQAVVIPYNSSLLYYQLRGINGRRFYKPPTDDAGPEPLFNEAALKRNDKTPIFVVESPICAMSIIQSGGNAVAICGTGINGFIRSVTACVAPGAIVLAFDNDTQGEKTTHSVSQALERVGAKHIVWNIAGNEKDPNELLMLNPQLLKSNIDQAIKAAKLKSRSPEDLIPLEELSELPIPPQRFLVDKLIPENCLCLLVAASKMGKSWFALHAASSIVTGEAFLDELTNTGAIIYYALEDNDERLKSRKELLMGGKPLPLSLYIQTRAKNLDNGFLDEIRNHKRRIPDLKLVIVDTFGEIRGRPNKNEDVYMRDGRELGSLRRFCTDEKLSILLLHHTRKTDDANDPFNNINGSTGIMGAADVTLLITKKRRMDDAEPFKLSITGRAVIQDELLIQRLPSGRWYKVGTPEQESEKRRLDAFNNSKVVACVLELMKRHTYGWQGTVRDFIKQAAGLLGENIGSEIEVGREIARVDVDLLTIHQIKHSVKKRNYANVHIFAPSKVPSLLDTS